MSCYTYVSCKHNFVRIAHGFATIFRLRMVLKMVADAFVQYMP